MKRGLWALVALVACAASLGNAAKLTARIIRAPMAADTLVMGVTWTNPADDGKGPLDSLRIRLLAGPIVDSSVIYRPPFPVRRDLRVPIPLSAYQGVSATYQVRAEATVYRRGVNSVPLQSNSVNIVLSDALPPSVGGFILTAQKIP